MSTEWILWSRLPKGFLKMRYRGWCRYYVGTLQVIVELAEQQKFECAFCSSNRNLVIEHDHDPFEGPGHFYTANNIRGIVCHRCNWHLMLYEKDAAGEDRSFEHVYSRIGDQEYETYIYKYDCRVTALREKALEERLGELNYMYRETLLRKFDAWKEWGEDYPWPWGFQEIKEKRHGKIRTLKRFVQGLDAIFTFVAEELERNPDYMPPDDFFRIIIRVKPMLDEIRPIVEQRLREGSLLTA